MRLWWLAKQLKSHFVAMLRKILSQRIYLNLKIDVDILKRTLGFVIWKLLPNFKWTSYWFLWEKVFSVVKLLFYIIH